MSKKLLFFHQANCPPCEEAKPKIAALLLRGLAVHYIDLTPGEQQHPQAAELVQRYRVKFTPTAVVVDADTGERRGSQFGKLINTETLVSLLS